MSFNGGRLSSHLLYFFYGHHIKRIYFIKILLIKKICEKLNEGKRVTHSCNSLICYWLIRTILLKTLSVKLGITKRGQTKKDSSILIFFYKHISANVDILELTHSNFVY